MSKLEVFSFDTLNSIKHGLSDLDIKLNQTEQMLKKRISVSQRKKDIPKKGFNRSFDKFNLTVSSHDVYNFLGSTITSGSFISTRATLTIGLKEIYFSVSSNGNKIPITKYSVDITSDGSFIYLKENPILEAILHRANISFKIAPCPTKSHMAHVEYVIGRIAGVYIFTFDAPMSILLESNKNTIVSHDMYINALDDIRLFNNNYDVANTIGKYLRFVERVTSIKDNKYILDVRKELFFSNKEYLRGVIKYDIKNGFVDDSSEAPILTTLMEYYKHGVDNDEFNHLLNILNKGILLEVTHIKKNHVANTYVTSGICVTNDSNKEIPFASDVKDLVFEGSDYGITVFSPNSKPYFWNVNGLIHKIDMIYSENLSALIWYREIDGQLKHIRITDNEFKHFNILTTNEIESHIDSSYMSSVLKKRTIDIKLKELDMRGSELSHQTIKQAHEEEMFKLKMSSEKEKNEFLIYSLELKLEELKTSKNISNLKNVSSSIAGISALIKTIKNLLL